MLAAGGVDVSQVRALVDELEDELVPHELAEEGELYPLMSRALGGDEPLPGSAAPTPRSSTRCSGSGALVDAWGAGPVDEDDVIELRRLLYGLYGVMRLHNAQEEEELYSLVDARRAG